MSETAPEAAETAPESTETGTETTGTAEPPKPSETVDFWRQKAREQEKRAKENADAAKRLKEFEDAQKTDAEKAAGRISELEKQLSDAQSTTLRFKVASKFGISDEDADLFLTGTDEDTLVKQAERLGARADERRQQGNRVPTEGTSPPATGEGAAERQFARQLFAEG